MDICESQRVLFIREGGVELMKARICIPQMCAQNEELKLSDCEFNAFYADISVKCAAYLEGEYGDMLRNEYRMSDEKNKRFGFRRYLYELICRVTSEGEKYICVVCDVLISRKGGEKISAKRYVQIWDNTKQILVPVKYAVGSVRFRSLMRAEKDGMKADGLYICDGSEIAYRADGGKITEWKIPNVQNTAVKKLTN